MLTRQNFTEAQHRYAHFYLKQLVQFSEQYGLGGEDAVSALLHFNHNWEQTQQAQVWATTHIANPEIAQICSNFAIAGSVMLNAQILPHLRLPWYENALSASEICQDTHARPVHLANLGLVYIELGQFDLAQDYCYQALDLIEETDNFALLPGIYNKLARTYAYHGGYDRAFDTFAESLELSQQHNIPMQAGLAWEGMAIVARRRGQITEAIEYITQCQKIFYDINYEEGISNAHINLGNIFASQGKFEDSNEQYLLSLTIAKRLNLLASTCSIYANLGANGYQLGHYQQSESYHRNSLEIAEMLGDQLRIGRGFSNIGLALYYQKKYEEAKSYYNQALVVREQIGHKHGVAVTLNSLGRLALAEEKLALAQDYQQRSLLISQEINNNLNIILITNDLAEIALAQGHFTQTLQYFITCLEQMTTIDSPVVLNTVFLNIARYFHQHQHRWGEVRALITMILQNLSVRADIRANVEALQATLPPETPLASQFNLEDMAANIDILLEILHEDSRNT